MPIQNLGYDCCSSFKIVVIVLKSTDIPRGYIEGAFFLLSFVGTAMDSVQSAAVNWLGNKWRAFVWDAFSCPFPIYAGEAVLSCRGCFVTSEGHEQSIRHRYTFGRPSITCRLLWRDQIRSCEQHSCLLPLSSLTRQRTFQTHSNTHVSVIPWK